MSAKAKVLLVDDDKDLVETLRTVLENDGYEAEAAYDGAQCLEKVEAAPPDLIILDIMMRTMGDGMYVAQHLRGDEATRSIPIIVVSGINRVPPYSLWADEAWLPVDVFMEKPVEPEQLLEAVRNSLARQDTFGARGSE